MSDLIRVVDLEVWSHVGVPEAERANAQRLLLTLEMEVGSFAAAAATDDIKQTVNYYDVAQFTKKFSATRPRKLLETFAEELAREIMIEFSIRQISLEVKKFILPDAAWASVKISRPT